MMGDEIDAVGMNDNPEHELTSADPIADDANDNDDATQVPTTRRRPPRTIQPDTAIGLRNTELGRWNNEYLQNMATATKHKRQKKSHTDAKKNAVFWVFGQGIGAVGVGLGVCQAPHPLQCYSGEVLWDALCGEMRGQKRRRSDSDQQQEREDDELHMDELHIGRGDDDDVQPFMPEDDVRI